MKKKYSRKYTNFIKSNKLRKSKIVNSECKLLSLANVSLKHLEELSHITKNTNIMKYIGKGNIWTMKDLKQYMLDEKIETRKNISERRYYSFILVKDNIVVGFIAGRKNTLLLPLSQYSPFDLLLRMFISSKYIGQGYGKIILKLFIEKYKQILSSRKYISKNPLIKLISDIDENNTASIKIHLANNFKLIQTIKYPNKHIYNRYILTLNL
jgi:RimJ/RimL family protein N-acetyltransferase